jgi:hypothetical protein
MKKNMQEVFSGAAMAVAVAGLAAYASVGAAPANAASGTSDLVHCYGVNVCKGHNDCKTADNACGGHASCKGTGFVAMPSKSCADVGGTTKDEWKGSVASADLVHCYGVNICKGHNDCKTADNACGGHASCKGTGFVAAPAKSCTDIGGKAGA